MGNIPSLCPPVQPNFSFLFQEFPLHISTHHYYFHRRVYIMLVIRLPFRLKWRQVACE